MSIVVLFRLINNLFAIVKNIMKINPHNQFLYYILLGIVCINNCLFAEENANFRLESISFLTEGVSTLPKQGLPGPVLTLSQDAFPVVIGNYDKNSAKQAVCAATTVKEGRVIAFGHTDYCAANAIGATPDSLRFFSNAIFWVANKSQKDRNTSSQIRVSVWKDPTTANLLQKHGFNAKSTSSVENDFDVFIAGSVALNDDDYEKIMSKVQKGAGFITCGLGWGWSQLNPEKNLIKDHSGNRNFSKFGIPLRWADGTLDQTTNGGYSINKTADVTSYIYISEVLNLLTKIDPNSPSESLDRLTKVESSQLLSTLFLSYRYLSQEQRNFCKSIVENLSDAIIPTEKEPLNGNDFFTRLTVIIQTEQLIHGQADGSFMSEEVYALPAGDDFPGPVPENAQRLSSVQIPVKTSVPEWTSTGLYAAPGEVITIKVDPVIFEKFSKSFKVRIGVHSDTLWHLENWVRYPEISLEKTISSPVTKITNPFGGLIYIVVPKGIAPLGLGVVNFEITGGVSAPYFIKNVTSIDDWKNIRNNPAPWAELQGEEVIVTVPSRVIRNLDDPQALMETWDKILRLEAEFASGPFYRERPERITCDREISAGYMHSGYPVMTHMDVEQVLVDNKRLLTKGDWGFFHEFGHNHQSSMWTFEGAGEVTVNYFTLYVMEKLCGLEPGDARKELKKEQRLKLLSSYIAKGAKFEQWKQDPFLALNMTVQLRNQFGWEPFIRTISEYTKESPDKLPRTDLQKRDQWMIRLSKNTNVNLGPFFEKWGIPVSQEARDSIKDLPIWLPEEFNEL